MKPKMVGSSSLLMFLVTSGVNSRAECIVPGAATGSALTVSAPGMAAVDSVSCAGCSVVLQTPEDQGLVVHSPAAPIVVSADARQVFARRSRTRLLEAQEACTNTRRVACRHVDPGRKALVAESLANGISSRLPFASTDMVEPTWLRILKIAVQHRLETVPSSSDGCPVNVALS